MLSNFQIAGMDPELGNKIRPILVLLLGLSLLFFGYFFHRNEILLKEPVQVPEPGGIGYGTLDLFRLPPASPIRYLGAQQLLGWSGVSPNYSLDGDVPVGFNSALQRVFQLPDKTQGRVILLEFDSPKSALDYYFADRGNQRLWVQKGKGFIEDKVSFGLLGNYIALTLSNSTLLNPVILHSQLGRNLGIEQMGFAAVRRIERLSYQTISWDNQALGSLPTFQLPGLGRVFIMTIESFTRTLGSSVILRPYRIGELQALRAFSSVSDRVLYLQDVGEFYLVADSLSRGLSLNQKAMLKQAFHVSKSL